MKVRLSLGYRRGERALQPGTEATMKIRKTLALLTLSLTVGGCGTAEKKASTRRLKP